VLGPGLQDQLPRVITAHIKVFQHIPGSSCDYRRRDDLPMNPREEEQSEAGDGEGEGPVQEEGGGEGQHGGAGVPQPLPRAPARPQRRHHQHQAPAVGRRPQLGDYLRQASLKRFEILAGSLLQRHLAH